jgi:hypothetical protein
MFDEKSIMLMKNKGLIIVMKNDIKKMDEILTQEIKEMENMIITMTQCMNNMKNKVTLLLISRMNELQDLERQIQDTTQNK